MVELTQPKHRTTVREIKSKSLQRYRARCSCGWVGPVRRSSSIESTSVGIAWQEADYDATVHKKMMSFEELRGMYMVLPDEIQPKLMFRILKILAMATRPDFDPNCLTLPACSNREHYVVHDNWFCPLCLSDWWSIDSSRPANPSAEWLKIIARAVAILAKDPTK